ncbi:uncharacterized protein LOC136078532 [Hydra vulgaris]|uniref:Uncharacterized protein LOC136078532 n=1 Tax=Hydra vulgaris TaxID=6087 RepID=A0ABM4BMS5_HYDVU
MRSTMGQERLSSLAIISIENEVANNIDFDVVISEFASRKARKETLKKIWNGIKDLIGKNNYNKSTLPKNLIINGKLVYEKSIIAEEINNYFVNIGPNLASKIPNNSIPFNSYLKTYDKFMDKTDLKLSELRTAFSRLKSKKSEGFDKISVDIVKSVFDIEPSLFHTFNLSLKSGIVPDKSKIARITPIFKSGDKSNILNYRPISILPCFSKLLEKIMYHRL